MPNVELTYREAVRRALREEIQRDKAVYMMGEEIGIYGGAFGVTAGLLEEFGEERIRDVPISEGALVGAAVGSALTGMRPVVEIMFMDFITLCMDQLVNQAAKIRYMYGGEIDIPMVFKSQIYREKFGMQRCTMWTPESIAEIATKCTACGQCLPHCPNELDIPAYLRLSR